MFTGHTHKWEKQTNKTTKTPSEKVYSISSLKFVDYFVLFNRYDEELAQTDIERDSKSRLGGTLTFGARGRDTRTRPTATWK